MKNKIILDRDTAKKSR